MFLIECKADNSLTLVEDHDVIYNENTKVRDGDLVVFYVGKKTFQGYVREYGDDEKSLKTKQKQLLKEYKKNQSKPSKVVTPVTSPVKTRRKLKKESPIKETKEIEKAKKNKKKEEKVTLKLSHVETQKEVANLIKKSRANVLSSCESSDEEERSPTKDELKAELKRFRAAHRGYNSLQLASNAQSTQQNEDVKVISSDDEKKTEEVNELPAKKMKLNENNDENNDGEKSVPSQLFGKDHLTPMTQLGNSGIYCITNIYDYALSGKQVTHIARRLIDGVFTKKAIASCTFTGQAPRAQGKERQIIPVSALDDAAKNAIIDFAIQKGESRQIKIPDRNVIVAQMSQRLGEIKREISSKAAPAPPLPDPASHE
ncbi:uncharacterized protein LOC130669307 [Microplitis mediator]|uniref:uncharacterized protein LOC130664825 n=1 Tax=Microplitis mediator TaxID=375433 RepID=UPI0025539A97|nr:uncharacterized protein LOC130664825 [Microplitis mediator]XP_057328089.1 uncharacterized protein LOC130669307 [Microplitis mediator]